MNDRLWNNLMALARRRAVIEGHRMRVVGKRHGCGYTWYVTS